MSTLRICRGRENWSGAFGENARQHDLTRSRRPRKIAHDPEVPARNVRSRRSDCLLWSRLNVPEGSNPAARSAKRPRTRGLIGEFCASTGRNPPASSRYGRIFRTFDPSTPKLGSLVLTVRAIVRLCDSGGVRTHAVSSAYPRAKQFLDDLRFGTAIDKQAAIASTKISKRERRLEFTDRRNRLIDISCRHR